MDALDRFPNPNNQFEIYPYLDTLLSGPHLIWPTIDIDTTIDSLLVDLDYKKHKKKQTSAKPKLEKRGKVTKNGKRIEKHPSNILHIQC
jgi:hypothetical protein